MQLADELETLEVPSWPTDFGYVSADDLRGSQPTPDHIISAILEAISAEFLGELGSDWEPTRRGVMLDDLAGKLEQLKSTF